MRSVTCLVLASLVALGCSKKDEKTTETTSATTTPSATVTATATATAPVATTTATAQPDVDVSPEMKDFMSMLDGTSASVGKALKKHASKANQTSDLANYNLKDPKVTKAEKVGAMQCYTMVSASGATQRESRLCWDSSGKIAQVTDKMVPATGAMP